MNNQRDWIDKVHRICQHTGQEHLDVIVDQSGIPFSLIPVLSSFAPGLQWQSLFQGLPEEIHLENAPLLIRFVLADAQQRHWLYELATEMSSKAPVLVLGSAWPFAQLASWLTHCVDASYEGRGSIFRFWDTQVTPWLFSDILTREQQQQLNRPVLFWSWQDRDGQPVLLDGNGTPLGQEEQPEQLMFSDHQFEEMMCLCDVKTLLNRQKALQDLFPTKEAVFAACFHAMRLATQEGILLDEQRNTWVIHYLQERHRLAQTDQ